MEKGRRKRVVIVGAGLAGSVLAHSLCPFFDVVVVEARKSSSKDYIDLVDVGIPANSDFLYGFGPGGTTAYWHNGLIEPHQKVLDAYPIGYDEIRKYLSRAHRLLSEVTLETVRRTAEQLQGHLVEKGFNASYLGMPLYYPHRRQNLWKKLTDERTTLIIGDALRVVRGNDRHIDAIEVIVDGETRKIVGDLFVLAAGGLLTPAILSQSDLGDLIRYDLIGEQYEDHPMGFVGEMVLRGTISNLWNFSTRDLRGFIRIPIQLSLREKVIGLYLRPAIERRLIRQRSALRSALSDVRNEPRSLKRIVKLLASVDDVAEVAAIKFGLYLPSRRFSLLLVAEQPNISRVSGAFEGGRWKIARDWRIDPEYLEEIEQVILRDLPLAVPGGSFNLYSGWKDELKSASHHSGTCRMGKDPGSSVCDSELRVWGTDNLYLCDGSVVSRSGYCNTGLLIASMALRLADLIGKSI